MSTLKQRVLNAVDLEYPGTLTNAQIATRLGANEPSVRRAMNELEREGKVLYWGETPTAPRANLWQCAPHVVTTLV